MIFSPCFFFFSQVFYKEPVLHKWSQGEGKLTLPQLVLILMILFKGIQWVLSHRTSREKAFRMSRWYARANIFNSSVLSFLVLHQDTYFKSTGLYHYSVTMLSYPKIQWHLIFRQWSAFGTFEEIFKYNV